MFINTDLQDYLDTSSVIRSQSAIIAEWNMNIASNIAQIGNYRFRPTDPTSPYNTISSSFNVSDTNNEYTGATDNDVVIDGGIDDNDVPVAFKTKKEKERLLFSLEDCFGKFRPRSGINKIRFFGNRYSHFSHPDMFQRPRYYIADRNDPFKYWTSYRTEDGVERGIANKIVNNQYYIDDAAPFVVYEKAIPANRIVVKMQTNVGNIDLGPFNNEGGTYDDPFYGVNNKTVPVRWKVQYLPVRTLVDTSGVRTNIIESNWTDAIAFNPDSARLDGSAIVKEDGYVELAYGLLIPNEYRNAFYYSGTYTSSLFLPDVDSQRAGAAYLVKEDDSDPGTYYVATSEGYVSFEALYGWYVNEETVDSLTSFATNLVSPSSYSNNVTGQVEFAEFQYIGGIRIVAETMNVFDSSFDLIELSPRLSVNLVDKVKQFSVTKSASDLGVSGMPVGQLLAGTGKVTLFDYDQAFLDTNQSSIVSQYLGQNIKFNMYEIVSNVNGYDYYIPIKTMYSEGFPEISSKDRSADLSLRDMFFYLESITAPQLLIQNVSLSYAICTLLDYVGFSNYSFKRNEYEDELIIPYFMIGPDKSIAEVLNELAVSAQAAMFFDEYNNFIVMSKGYMMPTTEERVTDFSLRGSNDFAQDGTLKNSTTTSKLANIMEIASQTNHLYNDGVVNYTTRYIQRSYGTVTQANMVDKDKTWIYKPALLWEVSSSEALKTKNDETAQQQSYVLGAIPLNSDLTDSLPSVSNHRLTNNTIDLGDGIYWLPRYSGYLYANGEVIKFDAVQFSVPGLTDAEITSLGANADGDNVWITSVQEYQRYFANVPFNGKIYPTGLVRIYSEPNYEVVSGVTRLKNGVVAKHGRMQFGTGKRKADGTTVPVYHNAGLSNEWSSDDRLRGVDMETRYLFGSYVDKTVTGIFSDSVTRGVADISDAYAQEITVTITGGTGTDTVINCVNHGLNTGDIVYFNSYGTLPNGITKYGIYHVISTTAETFKVSATAGGSSLQLTNAQLSNQSTTQLCSLVLKTGTLTGIAVDANAPANFTKTAHGLTTGQPVYVTNKGTADQIETNKIYTVITFTDDTFGLQTMDFGSVNNNVATTISLDACKYPAVIECEGHRFIAGDPVKFSEGYLPGSIVDGQTYYVSSTGLSEGSFVISEEVGGDKVILDVSDTYVSTALLDYATIGGSHSSSVSDWESHRIVVTDSSFFQNDLTVEKVSGSGIIQPGTKIESVDTLHNYIILDTPVSELFQYGYVDPATSEAVVQSIRAYDKVSTKDGVAGKTTLAKETTRNGIIKNFLSNIYVEEAKVNRMFSTQTGTVQSSAFVMNGYQDSTTPSLVSYVYKPLEDRFIHFGTRMRIIGAIDNNEYRGQSPAAAKTYYTASGLSPEQTTSIGGSSGGIAIMVNPETNNGYYFEIAALTANNLSQYSGSAQLHNILFYKVKKNENSTVDTDKAIPVKLWGGVGNITVDEGKMVGQYRVAGSNDTTVYDIAVEYQKIGNSLRFYLYINNVMVGIVDDDEPLEIYNNMALFVRSSSRVMFENVYALTDNYSQNTTFKTGILADSVFSDNEISANDAFRKYALSGLVQSTYLSGISAIEPPKYKIYFEEFGTIMREAAYFNVRYDKAYPALYAMLSPTINNVKGYTVSGFNAGAYKAEFLIFNNTDAALYLDSSTGNYLRIQGVTFTQQSAHELSVDEYYSKRSDLSNPQFITDDAVTSAQNEKKVYQDIKFSRMTHGRKQFSITSSYIQSQDEANNMMGWLSEKIMKPRKSIGVRVFGMPTVQLGDIAEIDYTNSDGINEIAETGSRFVVYNIEYNRKENGPETIIYLSEVGQ